MSEQDTRRTSPLKVGQRVKAVSSLVISEGEHTGTSVPHGCIGEVAAVFENRANVRFAFYHDGVVVSGLAEDCSRSALETVLGRPRMIGEARPGSGGAPTPSGTPRRRSGRYFAPRSELTEGERDRIGTACPKCGKGTLREKRGKRGPFVACDQFHVTGCTYSIVWWKQDGEQGQDGERHEHEEHEPEPQDDEPQPQDEPAPGTIDAIIASIARKAAEGTVNEARVRAIIAEELDEWAESFKPGDRSIVVQVKDAPKVEVKGKAHVRLADVLQAIAACDPTGEETGTISYPNVMLVGPAGSGKTTLAVQVAGCLGLPWDGVSCHPEMPASKIEGRMLVKIMTGEEVYIPTGFVRIVRDGGVWVNDEGDNMNGGLSIVYNAVLANGWMTLPNGDQINRHRNTIFIHCANTYGSGSDPAYVREQQDAAFLDRFVGMKFFVDYDIELEQTLCPEAAIRTAVYKVRTKVAELGLARDGRTIVGTRALLAARRIVTREGKSIDEALRRITDGWTKHNRQSCGIPLAA
jgi:ssDNA-binding Zn-finger/Zn-ribbon topoisomerase 1